MPGDVSPEVNEHCIYLICVFFYQRSSISNNDWFGPLYSLYMDFRKLTFRRIANSAKWRFLRKYNRVIQILESRKFRSQLAFDRFLEAKFNRNETYRYFQKSFRVWSPNWVRKHRSYFATEGRGFGEDAFHAAWIALICEFKPKKMLEIGVYRGQTLSLWALAGKKLGLSQEILGISPLDSSGDEVSLYQSLDYLSDIQTNFHYFGLPNPDLLKAFSTDVEALQVIESGNWDLIYIDGSHEYSVVNSDLKAAAKGLVSGGILVIDDSSLFTDFKLSTSEAFRGHPGPSKVFEEIDSSEFEFLFGVGHNNVLRKR